MPGHKNKKMRMGGLNNAIEKVKKMKHGGMHTAKSSKSKPSGFGSGLMGEMFKNTILNPNYRGGKRSKRGFKKGGDMSYNVGGTIKQFD
jgi:hypothetical protein